MRPASMRASRLVSILMMLQTRGRVSVRVLADHLEVSIRPVYRTADVRLSPRGRKLLCSASAAVEDAIDAALAGPAGLDAGGWLRVTIPIESIGHATGQLLSLGADAEVLGPAELRARVRDTARAVAARYSRRRAPVPRPRPRKLA
jgi:predicted DNA-binding transcriptional regulator YafY